MKRLLCFLFIMALLNDGVKADEPKLSLTPSSSEQKTKGAADYVFVFEGFPINSEMTLSYKRLLKADPKGFASFKTIKILEDGKLVIDNKVKTDFLCASCEGFVKGEKIEFRLEEEGKLLAEAGFVLNPIIISSKEGSFSLSVVLDSIQPKTAYHFHFNGLNENEALKFLSLIEKEVIDQKYFHKDGNYFVYSPDAPCKKGGVAIVKFTRDSGDLLSFELPWGSSIAFSQ